MALDFPSSPTNGQAFYPLGGPVWVYNSTLGVWKRNAGTASPMNKLVNPAFQIAQQQEYTGTSGEYAADQWLLALGNGSTAELNIGLARQSDLVSPRGSKYSLTIHSDNNP